MAWCSCYPPQLNKSPCCQGPLGQGICLAAIQPGGFCWSHSLASHPRQLKCFHLPPWWQQTAKLLVMAATVFSIVGIVSLWKQTSRMNYCTARQLSRKLPFGYAQPSHPAGPWDLRRSALHSLTLAKLHVSVLTAQNLMKLLPNHIMVW